MTVTNPTLHLIMGLPGSGKTTLAKHLQKITKSIRLSSDEYRLLIFPEPTFSQKEHDNLYGMIDHNVEHLLSAGHSVIYDANLNRKKHREEKYRLAKKYNADVMLWCLTTPSDLSMQRRIDDQDHVLIPEGETPEKMFERISILYEAPTKSEKCVELDGSKITSKLVKKYLE